MYGSVCPMVGRKGKTMVTLTVRELTLTDGSVVWNVEMGAKTFACISDRAALDFADQLQACILVHTNEDVRVITRRGAE